MNKIQETYYILHVATILYQAKRALSLTGKARWYGLQLWKSNESSWHSRPSEVTAPPLPTLFTFLPELEGIWVRVRWAVCFKREAGTLTLT